MPTIKPNTFTSYVFSEDELNSAPILTSLQKQAIQNLISNYAETKLGITFDPVNPIDFGIQVAWYDGKIEALRYLLDTSDEAEKNAILAAQLNSKEI